MTGSPTAGTEAEGRLRRVRAEVSAQRAASAADLDEVMGAAALTATDDEHDPEGATIAFERARLIALVAAADDRLAAIDAALARCGTAGYGECRRCARPIGAERLAARPDTDRCVDCARESVGRRRR